MMRSLAKTLHENRNYRFWLCQVSGWAGYSLVTFFSITLIDDQVTWPHVGHIGLSAVLGILTTWPLRPLYHQTFDLPLLQRIVIATLAVFILSGLWTVLRIVVFAWIVGQTAIWDEFNYWYFGSLFVFLSWTVLYYGIKYYELHTLEHAKLMEESALKQREQLRRKEAESATRNAQLQMLRYQLNPHFLFNTLNSINALVRLNESRKAQDMIQQLSRFLRHSLEDESRENVSLDQELETLMLYLAIEQIRFEDRLELEFDVEPLAREALVPSLLLQPIFENSMKYAIADSEDGGAVSLKARVVDDELQLEVSDTGPGMEALQNVQGQGIGLSNTLNRLETLYGRDYTFETNSVEPTGLCVRINIPFQTAPEEWREKAGVV
ncbi:MAG: sensor histidine kinase [Haliea sp.]|jgi:sensor histidine kinase YesM|nr:sensor histidine kinase [Haliea sp.]